MRLSLRNHETELCVTINGVTTAFTKGADLSDPKARATFVAAFGPIRDTIQRLSPEAWAVLAELVRLGERAKHRDEPVVLRPAGDAVALGITEERTRRLFPAKDPDARISIARPDAELIVTWKRQGAECLASASDPFEGRAVRFLPDGASPAALKTYAALWRDAVARPRERHVLAMIGDELTEIASRLAPGLDERVNEATTLGPIRFCLLTTRDTFWRHIRDHLSVPQVTEILAQADVRVIIKRPPPGTALPFFGSLAFVQPGRATAESTPEHVFYGATPRVHGVFNTRDVPYMHLRPKVVAQLEPDAVAFVNSLSKRLTQDFFAVWDDPTNEVLYRFNSRAHAAVDPAP